MKRFGKVGKVSLLLLILLISSMPLLAASNAGQPPLFKTETEMYAKRHGVTIDEARHRLKLQDVAGELDAELSIKEAETFAGLWIEHTPTFRVIVQFTCD